mmetsp:Transcript_10069/g.898  ORF Transcript_10069/g.898 Transcript_10069/m.898 type:complete len:145 (+) Transcript_10069:173-607(+)
MKLQLKNNLKKYQRLILFYKIKNKGIFMINMVKKGYNKTNKGIKEEVMEVIDIMEDNKDLNGIMMYMILMKEIMSRNILINKILDNSKDLSISKKSSNFGGFGGFNDDFFNFTFERAEKLFEEVFGRDELMHAGFFTFKNSNGP